MKKVLHPSEFLKPHSDSSFKQVETYPFTDVCHDFDKDGNLIQARSDTSVILDAESFSKYLTSSDIQRYIDSIRQTSTNKLGDFNDEQLLSVVRSRNCQSPSQLKAWLTRLDEVAQTVVKDETSRLDKEDVKTSLEKFLEKFSFNL